MDNIEVKEVAIGDIIEKDGIVGICSKGFDCYDDKCCFYGRLNCDDILCMDYERSDNTNVVFIMQEKSKAM
jgi:hypothetical protein